MELRGKDRGHAQSNGTTKFWTEDDLPSCRSERVCLNDLSRFGFVPSADLPSRGVT
jgi:hypothetical protein